MDGDHTRSGSGGASRETPGETILGGRFELVEHLGSGGFGSVWRAHDLTLHRTVALKRVRAPDGLAPEEAERLRVRALREARALARLSSPHVVTVHEVVDERPFPWIVMEYVEGGTLRDALDEGVMAPADAARVARDVLSALTAAHEAGVVHRDVKPANVLLRPDGRAVLTDFGIAMVEGTTSTTSTGEMVGTPEYLAPERGRGERPVPASDLWSLGVLLYVMTEDTSPFRRAHAWATLAAVLHDPHPAPRLAGPLAPLVDRLLEKDPRARADAAETAAALDAVIAGTPPPVHDARTLTARAPLGEAPAGRRAAPGGSTPDRPEVPSGEAGKARPVPPPVPPSVPPGVPGPAAGPGTPSVPPPSVPPHPAPHPGPPPSPQPSSGPAATAGGTAPGGGPASPPPSPPPSPPLSPHPSAHPDAPGPARPARRDSRVTAAAATAVAVAIVAAGGVITALSLTGRDDDPAARPSPSPSVADTLPAARATTVPVTTSAPPAATPGGSSGTSAGLSITPPPPATAPAAGDAVPPGYRRVSPANGVSLLVPSGWTRTTDASGNTAYQASDGMSRLVVRVLRGNTADPYAEQAGSERETAAGYGDYRRLELGRGTFGGGTSATWEYTFVSADGRRHIRDVRWRAGGDSYNLWIAVPGGADWATARHHLDVALESFTAS